MAGILLARWPADPLAGSLATKPAGWLDSQAADQVACRPIFLVTKWGIAIRSIGLNPSPGRGGQLCHNVWILEHQIQNCCRPSCDQDNTASTLVTTMHVANTNKNKSFHGRAGGSPHRTTAGDTTAGDTTASGIAGIHRRWVSPHQYAINSNFSKPLMRNV